MVCRTSFLQRMIGVIGALLSATTVSAICYANIGVVTCCDTDYRVCRQAGSTTMWTCPQTVVTGTACSVQVVTILEDPNNEGCTQIASVISCTCTVQTRTCGSQPGQCLLGPIIPLSCASTSTTCETPDCEGAPI